ncbi:MAG: class I SAM-dependent methyltransferase [Saezia sp.]
MADTLINFESWLTTPVGQYMIGWEQPVLDKAVEDIFGYHALQFGLPQLQGLGNNRMAHRWLVLDKVGAPISSESENKTIIQPDLYTRFDALPFPDQSIDLIILPHTLDLSADPHATLREVVRVLVPEGKIVITGINPTSLWGLLQRRVNFAQRLGMKSQFLPLGEGSLIGYWRLRDWLRLLNLNICSGSFGCYRPAFKKQKWLDKAKWMEAAGDRWWPILGATYQITAVKRIQGVKLIGANWKKVKAAKTVAAGASKVHQGKKDSLKS